MTRTVQSSSLQRVANRADEPLGGLRAGVSCAVDEKRRSPRNTAVPSALQVIAYPRPEPALGKVVGLAYVAPDQASPGKSFDIKVEGGRLIQATVIPIPFYDPDNKRQEM